MKYRIKEVNIPLRDEKLKVFYPEIKRTRHTTTGVLWWKKSIQEEYWTAFYKYSDDAIVPFQTTHGKVVCCDALEEAQKIIDDYNKKWNDDVLKSLKTAGADCADEKYVTIHEPKKIKNHGTNI